MARDGKINKNQTHSRGSSNEPCHDDSLDDIISGQTSGKQRVVAMRAVSHSRRQSGCDARVGERWTSAPVTQLDHCGFQYSRCFLFWSRAVQSLR